MFNKIMVLVLGISIFGIIGCNIKTPEINGIVLDEETKQPVEGAWVRGTIEIYTKTVGGKVHSSLSIDEPHTRTNKQGRFVIPSRSIKKATFPAGFGTEVVSVGIGASTPEDKGGRLNVKGEKLKEFLGKRKVEVTINSKPVKRTEEEYFAHLQSLYNYCLTGRSSVEAPAVEGGCDEWELNYAITKHERYLERYKKYAAEGKVKGYFATLDQQTYLYEKKGDLKKAIKTLKESIALMQRRGLLRFEDWQKDKEAIVRKIKELEKKIGQKQGE